VEIDRDRIKKFRGSSDHLESALVYGGIYVCRCFLVVRLKPYCSLEKDIFPHLANDRKLLGVPFDGYFIDIGVPESLTRAQQRHQSSGGGRLLFSIVMVLNHDDDTSARAHVFAG